MSGQTCNGCVGRGTGGHCAMCSLPIPPALRRTPSSPPEWNPSCPGCPSGARHSHINPGGAR